MMGVYSNIIIPAEEGERSMVCPCKDCTKRWVTETTCCHSSCTEYKEWAEHNKRQSELLAKRKACTESIGKVLYGHRRR